MKKFLTKIGFVGAFAALLLGSCKTDFDITAEYQVTPIIFGLLDQNEEYHYIRINKTFLGQGNAFDFAQVDDSSYFNTVDATITEIVGGSIQRTWQLRDTILENKNENGVFFAPAHKLYYFKTNNNDPNDRLKDEGTYRLDAVMNGGEYTVRGTTQLVRNVAILAPTPQSTFGMRGSQVGDYKGLPVSWSVGAGAGGRNSRYNVKFVFHWGDIIAGDTIHKSFTWNLAELAGENFAGNSIAVSAPGEQFYQLVQSRIPVDASVTRRIHTKIEIILTAGSEDLTSYMLATQPASSLAQSKPEFTNLEGAIGLFSARYTEKRVKFFRDPIFNNYRTLDQNSMRELCEGPYTFQLNFCSNHPMDNSTSFRCD